jgi:hypothetical protein
MASCAITHGCGGETERNAGTLYRGGYADQSSVGQIGWSVWLINMVVT